MGRPLQAAGWTVWRRSGSGLRPRMPSPSRLSSGAACSAGPLAGLSGPRSRCDTLPQVPTSRVLHTGVEASLAASQGVAGALQEAQAEARGALEEASDAIQADRRVQEALGTPVQVSGPLSQSMSKSSVNGVTSSQLNMVVAVSGPRGSAQASIASSEGRGIPRTTR